MKPIKLNRVKLEAKWKSGGRKTSKWCNYYLNEVGGNSYLIEKANWKSYAVFILTLPLLLITLVVIGLYKVLGFFVGFLDMSITPLASSYLTLTEGFYRRDVVRSEQLETFKNLK